MAARIASDPGEAVVEDTAAEKPVNDLLHVGAEEPVLLANAFIVDLFQGLEMILHALVEGGGLRFF